MTTNKTLQYFQAKIFSGIRTTGDSERDFSGEGHKWQDYRTIKLPGYSGSQTLNLDDFWLEVFTHQNNEVIVKLTGLETITKFSDTHQIKEPFTIVANLTYISVYE